jgi:energy-coupling factor transport system ATP-binding protein
MAESEIRRLLDELLERLGLGALATANPFTLSGGEKRRLSVATALIMHPRLLILDEPTFGQDARTWGEIASILSQQRDAGQAIVLVTHDEDLIASVADRRVALAHGRVVSESSMIS